MSAKPIILYESIHTPADLQELRSARRIWEERDVYENQLKEFFEITHPALCVVPEFAEKQRQYVTERAAGQEIVLRGNWIYFPWSGMLAHAVGEKEYFALKTNRNRNIITREEQQRLQNFRVGIVGLSVGSNVATTLAYSGIARTIKLAEFDTLETTNLNRIRARIDQIGMRKIDIVSQQLYEIDPYIHLAHLADGLTKDTLSSFVLEEPKPQLIFEIIDSFEMKIHLRELARAHRIPVIMVTNLGDRVLMDVERYDTNPDAVFFNGRAGMVPRDILARPDITAADKHRYAVELAGGTKHVPQRALDSVDEIGKTLVGRPQLASTVTASGSFGAYLTKKIALGEHIPSTSWLVDFDTVFSSQSPFVIY